jgi:hypothetical protein
MTVDPAASPLAPMTAAPDVSAMPRHSEMILDLLRLHRVLAAMPELAPNTYTNTLFEELGDVGHPQQ